MGTAGLSWLCDRADMGLHGNRVQLGSLGEFFFLLLLRESMQRPEEGRNVQCLLDGMHLAHPLTHIRVQASAPRANISSGPHGA